jgi:hypothetical protein
MGRLRANGTTWVDVPCKPKRDVRDWRSSRGAKSYVVLCLKTTVVRLCGKAFIWCQKGDSPLSIPPTSFPPVLYILAFLHLILPRHPPLPYVTPGLLITGHVANDQHSGPVSVMNEQLKVHKQLQPLHIFHVQPGSVFCGGEVSPSARRTGLFCMQGEPS